MRPGEALRTSQCNKRVTKEAIGAPALTYPRRSHPEASDTGFVGEALPVFAFWQIRTQTGFFYTRPALSQKLPGLTEPRSDPFFES